MKVEQLHGPQEKSLQVYELEYLLQCDSPEVFHPYGLQKEGKIIVTRAPARLDIMGGIADYCGSNVFEMTLHRAAAVACQVREDNNLYALTLEADNQLKPSFQMSLDDFYVEGTLKSYTQIRNLFSREQRTTWAGYVLGCFFTLLKEEKIDKFPHGCSDCYQE